VTWRGREERAYLDRWYWFGLIRHTIRYYVRHRRFVALFRALWLVIVRHDNGESCQECGRDYLLWMAPGTLYEQVIGSRRGLYCLACFGRKAKAIGITVCWTPMVVHDQDGDHWREVDERVGAFTK
jgi:hypothetical protein